MSVAIRVLALAVVCVVVQALIPSPAVPCPGGWTHFSATDECYRFWGSEGWNETIVIRRTYDEAVEVCKREQAELPVIHNASQMDFLFDRLIGRSTGHQVWLQVREDLASREPFQLWRTNRGRHFDEFFDWDLRRRMPGHESCIALQAGGDRSRRIVGGNNKMVTVDCYERLGVLCAKQRVPVQLGAVNETIRGAIPILWRRELHLTLFGNRIPPGTIVSLQTTTDDYFATAAPRSPTNCSIVRPLVGDARPLHLNVSQMSRWSPHCNGTCDMAHLVIPEDLPLVRGARYSFCFFVPIPFASFKSEREFGVNLIPEVYLEVIQPREEYLRDVCTRHQNLVEGFMINGRDDSNRPLVRPYYFNSLAQGPHQSVP